MEDNKNGERKKLSLYLGGKLTLKTSVTSKALAVFQLIIGQVEVLFKLRLRGQKGSPIDQMLVKLLK